MMEGLQARVLFSASPLSRSGKEAVHVYMRVCVCLAFMYIVYHHHPPAYTHSVCTTDRIELT